MKITEIEAIPINLWFIPEVASHMLRATTHHGRVTVYRLTLSDGSVGYGDDNGEPVEVASFIGLNVLEALSRVVASGIQMACYDAAGKALGLPAHTLMGRGVRSRVPFAYWTIDLPPSVWADQTKHAVSLGYTSYKFKCRPWWDPLEQIEAASKAAPPGFVFWLDFNGHLREARLALPILAALSEYECVGGFESPIPQRDLEGYKMLRRKIDKPIVGHYGGGCCHVKSDPTYDPGSSAAIQIREDVFDGFVLGGGDVEDVRAMASVAHEARKPFWIQMVGSGLRAAWVAHLASTCKQALLSHIAAHDLWVEDIIKGGLKVEDGWMQVPQGHGLGVEVDENAIEELRSAPPMPEAKKISTVVYPSGVKWHFSDEQERHEAFYFGHLPGFVRGIRLEVREDDGSNDFADLYSRCLESAVVE